MSTARFLIGDTLATLPTLPDNSVDLVMTSPPFLALRSYLPADHPDKAAEIGSEASPGEFIDALLDVVEQCRRILAPHGSIVFELGDTYSGSGGGGGDLIPGSGSIQNRKKIESGQVNGTPKAKRTQQVNSRYRNEVGSDGRYRGESGDGGERVVPVKAGDGWPLSKSLCLIPELFRFALAYGFNPLTGRETPPWLVRNVVRWFRPNPPVGALADKFRPATSDMVVACTAKDRYFDLDAVRTPSKSGAGGIVKGGSSPGESGKGPNLDRGDKGASGFGCDPAGAPPLDTWIIPTHAYPGAHYATYPETLCATPIKAMCPHRVCNICGKASRRITEASNTYAEKLGASIFDGDRMHEGRRAAQPKGDFIQSAQYETVGWTDCGHDDWRNGVVLDPFAGSGTTLAVAVGHGRDAIGIDLDDRNAALAQDRLGMFLTVDQWAA